MKIALLTDIHANREAFEACLEDADARGADRCVLLGDFVGYGADPVWVVDKVRELVAAGASAVRGNHDEAAVVGPHPWMVETARAVAQWTHRQLDDSRRAFLAALPDTVIDADRLYVHANAVAPAEWGYIVGPLDAVRSLHATRCRFMFCGHMHEPHLYHLAPSGAMSHSSPAPGTAVAVDRPGQWLAIPGSVGQPRDGNPAACWAMFDTSSPAVTFHRVGYDHDRAAAKVLSAGLPSTLAERLRVGL